jgi:hypothetical protein
VPISHGDLVKPMEKWHRTKFFWLDLAPLASLRAIRRTGASPGTSEPNRRRTGQAISTWCARLIIPVESWFRQQSA